MGSASAVLQIIGFKRFRLFKQNPQIISAAIENTVYKDTLVCGAVEYHIISADEEALFTVGTGNGCQCCAHQGIIDQKPNLFCYTAYCGQCRFGIIQVDCNIGFYLLQVFLSCLRKL